MNRKFFGLILSIILIANMVATINVAAVEEKEYEEKTPAFQNIIVVGVMDLIDDTEEYRDFEIHVAVILDESIDIFISEEKNLRLYNPHGLFLDSVVVAFCDSWELV